MAKPEPKKRKQKYADLDAMMSDVRYWKQVTPVTGTGTWASRPIMLANG